MANPDPEAGLTLTRTFPIGGSINSGLITRNNDCVYACELTWPATLDPGCIWEIGGGGQGCWLGLNAGDGLVFSAGDGGVDGATSGNGKAVIVIDEATFLANYAGTSGTLCWDIDFPAASIRLWWNNDLIGQAVSPNSAFENNRFSGGNTGGFGLGVSSLVRNMTGQEFDDLDSTLRYYDGQLSAWSQSTGPAALSASAAGALAFTLDAQTASAIGSAGSGALVLSDGATVSTIIEGAGIGVLGLSANIGASTAIEGAAGGTIALSGSAQGRSAIQAGAGGSLVVSGDVGGQVAIDGAAIGTLTLDASAQAFKTELIEASLGAQLMLSGSASGEAATVGAAACALVLSLGSQLSSGVDGAFIGLLNISGSAAAAITLDAQGSGALAFTGSALALQIIIDEQPERFALHLESRRFAVLAEVRGFRIPHEIRRFDIPERQAA